MTVLGRIWLGGEHGHEKGMPQRSNNTCKGQGLGQLSALGCWVGNGATVLPWSHCVCVGGEFYLDPGSCVVLSYTSEILSRVEWSPESATSVRKRTFLG